MAQYEVTPSQRRALGVAIILALVGGALFLKAYFTLIIFAAILAFMFNGAYKHFLARNQKPGKSAVITSLVAAVTIIIPVVLLIFISVKQINHLVASIDGTNPSDLSRLIVDKINHVAAAVGSSYHLTYSEFSTHIQDALKSFSQHLLHSVPSLVGGFVAFFTTAVIFIYVFLSLLRNQTKIIDMIHTLNPLGKEISKLYLDRIRVMTKGMVKGQSIIATMDGLTQAALLAIAGLPNLFFFFFVVMTALSFIPLGGGIVAIPIGVVMILTGNVTGGLIVIGGNLLIVNNIDNIMRPRLVPDQVRLDSALTMLSVFAGVGFFGFLGIVIGPVIMIIIVTTVQVFLEVYRDIRIEEFSKAPKNDGSMHRASLRLRKLFKVGKETDEGTEAEKA